jgi:hypothetical protein
MLALFKDVVGAVPVAEIVELPRLGGSASASHQVLIDQNFDGAKITGEIARIGVGLFASPTTTTIVVICSHSWLRWKNM